MIYKVEPANAQKEIEDKIVVGHHLDYAVIRDEDGKISVTEDVSAVLQPGETFLGESVAPLRCLSAKEQDFLYDLFG